MYDIIFYKNKNGKEPVLDYIRELAQKSDKDSRIKFQKIQDYLKYLRQEGKNGKEPYIKRLDEEIWELRPLRDRILFAEWDGKIFVLLHRFMKQTRAAPAKEIERAKRNLKNLRERSVNDDEKKRQK